VFLFKCTADVASSEFLKALNIRRETAGYLNKAFKSFPTTGLEGPLEFPEVEAPEFLDNQHIKVVRLSALRTSSL
jgi:hypothetical protein